jgi:hypothetical protein
MTNMQESDVGGRKSGAIDGYFASEALPEQYQAFIEMKVTSKT